MFENIGEHSQLLINKQLKFKKKKFKLKLLYGFIVGERDGITVGSQI